MSQKHNPMWASKVSKEAPAPTGPCGLATRSTTTICTAQYAEGTEKYSQRRQGLCHARAQLAFSSSSGGPAVSTVLVAAPPCSSANAHRPRFRSDAAIDDRTGHCSYRSDSGGSGHRRGVLGVLAGLRRYEGTAWLLAGKPDPSRRTQRCRRCCVCDLLDAHRDRRLTLTDAPPYCVRARCPTLSAQKDALLGGGADGWTSPIHLLCPAWSSLIIALCALIVPTVHIRRCAAKAALQWQVPSGICVNVSPAPCAFPSPSISSPVARNPYMLAMTGTLALMPQVPSTVLPREVHATPRYSISARPSIKAKPSGPRQPRTQDLNDLRLRCASATATCSPSKHSVPTPDILPKPRRHTTRVASAPSSTSASSDDDTPTPVTSAPSSLVMTTTTTTTNMAHTSPTPTRASDSAPPFLLQRRHGPPQYFLPPTSISASHNSPSVLPLKQKRSFKITMNVYPNSPQHDVAAPPATEPHTYRKSLNPAPRPITVPVQIPSVISRPSTLRRSLPASTPPPEKALPPIPFPSTPTPIAERPRAAEPVSLCPPTIAGRPVSQDAEETIRQLEQLAAEIKHKAPASPPRSSATPLGVTKGVPRKSKATAGMAKVCSERSPTARLSVPHIVVTNPSTDNLAGGSASETPRAESPDSEDGSGNATEEELWVEQYGGWGTSEKGKWREALPEGDSSVHDLASSPHAAHNDRPATPANPSEVFYIYEPVGAPEFLAGSSTSPVARAAPGFHSRGSRVPCNSPPPSVARRRRRPAALVLANPEQADWYGDAPLGSAPPLPRSQPTPPLSQRPVTAPGPASNRSLPALPSELLLPRRSKSSDVVEATGAVSSETKPHAAVPDRRSEPLTVAPRASSSYALRGDRAQGRQAASWASSAPGTTSEPTSPRHGARPRLKSIRGFFKHFSK